MEENVTIVIKKPENIKCKTCIWSTKPYNCGCAKYKIKPSTVLYDGEDCEKYEKGEEEDE